MYQALLSKHNPNLKSTHKEDIKENFQSITHQYNYSGNNQLKEINRPKIYDIYDIYESKKVERKTQSTWKIREEKAENNNELYERLLNNGQRTSKPKPVIPENSKRIPSPLKTPQRIVKITNEMVDVGQRATQILNPEKNQSFSNLKKAISNIVFPQKQNLSSIREEEIEEKPAITVFEQHSYSSTSLNNSYKEQGNKVGRDYSNFLKTEEDENKKMAEKLNKIMKENGMSSRPLVEFQGRSSSIDKEDIIGSRNILIQRNPSKKLLEMRKTAKLQKCFKSVKKTNPHQSNNNIEDNNKVTHTQQVSPQTQIVYVPYPVVQKQKAKKIKKKSKRAKRINKKDTKYQDIKEYLDQREQELKQLEKSTTKNRTRSVTPKNAKNSKNLKFEKTPNKSNLSISTQKKTNSHYLKVVKDAQNSPIAVSVTNLRKDPVAFIVPFSNHKIPHSQRKSKSRSKTPLRKRQRKNYDFQKPVMQVSRKEEVDKAQERLKRIKEYDKGVRKQMLNIE